MSKLLTQVTKTIPAPSKLIVAVSGGVDSVVLLDLLSKLSMPKGYQLIVAHVDHALRLDSDLDAEFVRNLAEQRKLPFFLKRLSSPPTTNIEAWGRRERYSFFQELRLQEKADWILTAHTADDQVETILMKFFANRDLTSIAEIDPKRRLIRPLLTLTKLDLQDYAEKENLVYREDPSNASCLFLRNQVRNQLIPQLAETFGSGVRISIEEQARKANQDRSYFDQKVKDYLVIKDLTSKEKRLAIFPDLRTLLNDEYSIAWRVIDEVILMELGFRIGYRACGRVAEVVNHQTVACELPSGYRFSRSKGKYYLQKIDTW